MKIRIRFMVILAMWVLFVVSNAAKAGEVGNGGDADEILIHSIASRIAVYLSTSGGKSKFPEVDANRFQSILDGAKVKVADQDLIDRTGNRRTAINQLESMTIFVDRRLWGPIRNEAPIAVQLIFHEFLGLLGIENGDYLISSRIASDSPKILAEAANESTDLYFLAASNLRSPIALYRTSVQLDSNGLLVSGTIARPMRVITTQFQQIVFEGDTISRQGLGYLMPKNYSSQGKDRHVQFRRTEQESWQPISDDPWIFVYPETFSLSYIDLNMSVSWSGRLSGLDGYPRSVKFNIDESPNSLRFATTQPGKFKDKDGDILDVSGVDIGPRYWRLSGPSLSTTRLRAPGSNQKLLFDPFVDFDLSGGVTGGSLKDATIVYRGRTYSIFSEVKFESGFFQVTLEDLKVDSTYSGIPVLYNRDAADAMCRGYGMDQLYYVTSHTQYFTGEKSFYDFLKGDFVVLKSGSAQTIDSLYCTITIHAPINDIVQVQTTLQQH